MTIASRTQRSFRYLAVTAVATMAVSTACMPQSVLITPVSSKRGLKEIELSRDSWSARDKIALIDVDGILMTGRQPQLLGAGERPVSLLVEKLTMARKDARVKAVLLKINSPGGTVVASELLHDELQHFRKSGKPLVAVIMDVGASGGYYIACACDQIIAQPSSVTGSIGVVMQMFDFSGTMHKIGASSDAITSGSFKDAGSPFRSMRPEERAMFQGIVNDMYERFVKVVTDGRPKLEEQAVRSLADGRVFSAKQALDAGLIDGITTLRKSITVVKERAGLEKVRLVTYDRPYRYKPNYYATQPAAPPSAVSLFSVDVAGMLNRSTPQFMYLWQP